MTDDPKKLGKRIREAREACGYSQEDVGDALQLTRSAVSLWEKGRSVPEDGNLVSLASVLKVEMDYLKHGKGSKPFINKGVGRGKSDEAASPYRRTMMHHGTSRGEAEKTHQIVTAKK